MGGLFGSSTALSKKSHGFGGGCEGASVPTSANRTASPYLSDGTAPSATTTIGFLNTIAPFAGKVKNLYARALAAVTAGTTLIVTVWINGVASTLTVTIANADGTNAVSDLTNQPSVSAGDRIQVSPQASAAGAQKDVAWGFILEEN